VLASTRSGEQVTVDLARLATGPETTRLRPEPLSIQATATLCERRLGTKVADDFAAACRKATGGNPFFLEALLREAKEQNVSTDARDAVRVRRIGPAAVAQAVLLRLSAAPAAATALVRAVAVLGDGASLAEAAGLAGLAEEEVARAADLLVALAILSPGEGLEFTHPIVREAVYADIGAREHGMAHARAAVAWLRRALAEPPPPSSRAAVLLELGSAELRLATPEAVGHLAAAVELTREPRLLASSVRWLANALTMSGQADRAVEAIEPAIETVQAEDREQALLLEAELASHAQEGSLEARAAAATRLERQGDLDGATPGERLVLAVLAFQRARASESASEAVGSTSNAGSPTAAAGRKGARRRRPVLSARGRPACHGRAGSRGRVPGARARRRSRPRLDPGDCVRGRVSGMGFPAARRRGASRGRRADGAGAACRA
jgi:hypothetical protein